MEPVNDAKRIIEYCKEALKEIRAEEPTGALWERRWASLITLLRTTCDVLRREAPSYWNKHMKTPNATIKGRDCKNKWSPDIFGKFIWTDANLFLHQGTLTTGQSRTVFIQGASVCASAAGEKLNSLPPSSPPPSHKTSYHMNTEPYKDQDPRDMANEVIAWLEHQIKIAETCTCSSVDVGMA